MIYFKGLNGCVIFLYYLNFLDKSVIDLYVSNIGKIIKYINIICSNEFKYDIINLFYCCY